MRSLSLPISVLLSLRLCSRLQRSRSSEEEENESCEEHQGVSFFLPLFLFSPSLSFFPEALPCVHLSEAPRKADVTREQACHYLRLCWRGWLVRRLFAGALVKRG